MLWVFEFCEGSTVSESRAIALASGCCSTLSIVLLRYATYSSRQCDDYHSTLVEIMKYFDMKKTLPAIEHPFDIDGAGIAAPTPTEDTQNLWHCFLSLSHVGTALQRLCKATRNSNFRLQNPSR